MPRLLMYRMMASTLWHHPMRRRSMPVLASNQHLQKGSEAAGAFGASRKYIHPPQVFVAATFVFFRLLRDMW